MPEKGDILEVKLSDTAYNPYFRAKVHIKNRKEMKQLIEDLKNKGVNLYPDWFD